MHIDKPYVASALQAIGELESSFRSKLIDRLFALKVPDYVDFTYASLQAAPSLEDHELVAVLQFYLTALFRRFGGQALSAPLLLPRSFKLQEVRVAVMCVCVGGVGGWGHL